MALCIVIAFVILIAAPASAADFKAMFVDTLDNHIDVGPWLDQAYGFLPIFTLVTEPALGDIGIGGGISFVHRSLEERGKPLTHFPSVSGVAGFYTRNESWGGGVFHSGHWRKDTIRYTGVIFYSSINLAYYPPAFGGAGFDFHMDGTYFVQRLALRIKDSPWFLGGVYLFFSNEVGFKGTSLPIDPDEIDTKIGGLGPIASFDTRDYNFTTNRGLYGVAHVDFYDRVFGSDFNFTKSKLYMLGWLPYRQFVLGFRGDVRTGAGDIPFYALPDVKLRGIPLMRYQGEYAVVAETEIRWAIARRWAAVGFAGIGKPVPESTSFGVAETVWGAGAGGRYLLARNYNMFAGIDIARGPEEWAYYIVIGQWWNGL
jgi:hypothetical protein